MGPPASRRIPRVLRYSGTGCSLLLFAYAAFTLSGRAFQPCSAKNSLCLCRPATPMSMLFGLGSFPFARRYSGNRCFFLFLRVLRCFSSPGSLVYTMDSCKRSKSSTYWVSPFGYHGIYACLRLPHAFRSLPRPSSALGALASTLCSCSLDFFVILRLVTFFRSIDFLIATGLLRLSSRLSSCAVVKVRCELPLTSGFLFRILKTIQSRGQQLFLRTLWLFAFVPLWPFGLSLLQAFQPAIDLGLKPPLSLRLAP